MADDRFVYVRAGNVINMGSANAFGLSYRVPEHVAREKGWIGEADDAPRNRCRRYCGTALTSA